MPQQTEFSRLDLLEIMARQMSNTRQRMHDRVYPATLGECIDDAMAYRSETLDGLRDFARQKPWRGELRDRIEKFRWLHAWLCRVYGKQTTLVIDDSVSQNTCSGDSTYNRVTDVITLRGKLSVITYLHEFGHALGKGERGACRWSLNLYKRVFPRSFARLRHNGHMGLIN